MTKDLDQDLPINTGELNARICKAASERWPDDSLSPGIQIAHLPGSMSEPTRVGINADGVSWAAYRDAQWYVALHRYPRGTGSTNIERMTSGLAGNRIVQFKAKHTDLDMALLAVTKQLHGAIVVTEAKELETLLTAALKAVSK